MSASYQPYPSTLFSGSSPAPDSPHSRSQEQHAFTIPPHQYNQTSAFPNRSSPNRPSYSTSPPSHVTSPSTGAGTMMASTSTFQPYTSQPQGPYPASQHLALSIQQRYAASIPSHRQQQQAGHYPDLQHYQTAPAISIQQQSAYSQNYNQGLTSPQSNAAAAPSSYNTTDSGTAMTSNRQPSFSGSNPTGDPSNYIQQQLDTSRWVGQSALSPGSVGAIATSPSVSSHSSLPGTSFTFSSPTSLSYDEFTVPSTRILYTPAQTIPKSRPIAGRKPPVKANGATSKPVASSVRTTATGHGGGGQSSNANKRKKPNHGEYESDGEREVEGTNKPANRLPGACSHCKRLKMRCVFVDEDVCERCKGSTHECIVPGRKPRPPQNKREQLLAQLRYKDEVIDTLLRQIHNPAMLTPLTFAQQAKAPPAASGGQSREAIMAWMEKASGPKLQTRKATSTSPNQSEHESYGSSSQFKDHRGDMADDSDNESHENGSPGRRSAISPLPSPTAERAPRKANQRQPSSPRLHALPPPSAPIGLLADLALTSNKERKNSDSLVPPEGSEDAIGPANDTFYKPGPVANPDLRSIIIERQLAPEILTSGMVTFEEVEKLFEIYFSYMNPFMGVLDDAIHGPQQVLKRCPFLFTVVCAIASRFYTPRPDLYQSIMPCAKALAATMLIDGWKSVEICQAYILLANYSVPPRRWEEDRSWLYLGLAIRLATDLNLHLPTSTKEMDEVREREILNRERTWMICFNLDRSNATQFGKPPTIREDWIIRNSKEWYKKSKYNHRFDVHLNAYTQLLRIVARFVEQIYSDNNSSTGLDKNMDFERVTFAADQELSAFSEETRVRFANESDKSDPACAFRCEMLPYLVHYSRLVMFSFGFQQTFQKGLSASNMFFTHCLHSASSVVKIVSETLAKTPFFRRAPDGHFVFTSFAASFLLKLLRPQFSTFVDDVQRQRILDLVNNLIKVWANETAIDDRHAPKLYARFLKGLINTKIDTPPPEPKNTADTQTTQQQRSQSQQSQQSQQPNSEQRKSDRGVESEATILAQPRAVQPESQHIETDPQMLIEQRLTSSPVESIDGSVASTIEPSQLYLSYNGGDISGDIEMLAPDELQAAMKAIDDNWWNHGMMPGWHWGSVSPQSQQIQMAMEPELDPAVFDNLDFSFSMEDQLNGFPSS